MLYALLAMSFLMPILVIWAFIIGYNMNAPKKIKVAPKKEKKREMTEDEKMLERIDNARV
jgi:hypothetical protein